MSCTVKSHPSPDRRGRLDAISIFARIALGTVMVVAGALKLPDPAESVRAVRAFDLLPEAIVPAVGYGLPVVEVALGLLLITGLFTRTAAALIGTLQVAFIIGIAAAWVRGLEIDCGCFGGGGEQAGASAAYPLDIARDLTFLAAAAWVVVRPAAWSGLDRFMGGAEPAPEQDSELETD